MVLIILLSLTSTVILILTYKNKRLRNKYDRLLSENQEDSNVLFLKSRYASMGETVGNIAHQWKQPLNAIGLIQNSIKANLLYHGKISKEELLESVETSFTLLQHLSETIDTFYSFLSQRNNETMRFIIADELEVVRKITEYSFQNSQIKLNFVLDVNPTVQGNPNEFTHAILNLILNAKDAFDETETDSPAITVHVSGGEDICTITVCDNAGGIRITPIEMVFDLHITTKKSGSGLGLFMTKNIIENRFGGTIYVENKNGGACFTITLPYAHDSEYLSQVTPSDEKLSLERINQLTRKIIELEELDKQKENERIRLFFERQLVGMAITSPTKGWVHTNKKLQQMLGYTHEELSHLTWADVTHPDDLTTDVANFERMLSGEIDSYIIEKRYIRKDGGIIYAYLSIGCVRKEDGSVDYVLALIEDITERKAAQTLLEQRKKEFRSLAENIPDNIARWDTKRRYLYINPVQENTLNVTPADVIGKSLSEAFPNVDFSILDGAIAQVIETGKEVKFVRQHYQNIYGEMEFHNINLVPERDNSGQIVSVLGVGRDMSEIYNLQDEIASREKQFSSLVENLPGCAYIFKRSPDGRFSFPYASSGIQEIYGLAPQDVVEDMAPLHALAHPDDRPRIEEEIEKSVSEARGTHLVFRVLNPERGERWIDARTKIEILSDGTMLWHGIMLDITEYKEMEKKLKQRINEDY